GAQHLEQLATAAAQIEDRSCLGACLGRTETREVHRDTLLDVLAGSPELVFEMQVCGIPDVRRLLHQGLDLLPVERLGQPLLSLLQELFEALLLLCPGPSIVADLRRV